MLGLLYEYDRYVETALMEPVKVQVEGLLLAGEGVRVVRQPVPHAVTRLADVLSPAVCTYKDIDRSLASAA